MSMEEGRYSFVICIAVLLYNTGKDRRDEGGYIEKICHSLWDYKHTHKQA